MVDRPFEVICEIEPATRPDLMRVRHQIGVLSRISDAFLIPDNHIGRATVSSIAVAREVALMGGRAVAALNARDRNVLGFHRDLLTAAAYGVDEFLFVYGDRPETGKRSDDLTVGTMIGDARSFAADHWIGGITIGVSCGLGPLPAWKQAADVLYAQVSYSVEELVAWRESLDFDGRVYPGVLVLASARMAKTLTAEVPQLAVPDHVQDRLDADGGAGVDIAAEMVAGLRASGVFDGVHLIPVGRYREMGARLEADLGRR